ncbi:MAG: LacI family DNA-binding transcriptional regulator [Victivallales bacterium]|nr:LacI family DNA-binding transcriptional regulator [Victivallales bacterium]
MTGKRAMTLYEIAALAGTSKSTVSRVLNGGDKVSAPVRDRVAAVIEQHHFMPSIAARTLSRGRKNLIAVIAGGIGDGYFARVIRGIDIEAENRNNHLLCSFGRDDEAFLSLWQSMAQQHPVDGIVLVAPPRRVLDAGCRCRVPVVLCSARPEPGGGWERAGTVTADNVAGFMYLLAYLYRHGQRDLVHVAGPDGDYDAGARRQAFEQFVTAHPDCRGRVLVAGKSRAAGERAMTAFLQSRPVPEALVCYNDATAVGVREAIRSFGCETLPVITGCDGSAMAEILHFPTLEMPCEEIGREAAVMLFDRIAGTATEPEHRRLPMPLQCNGFEFSVN